MSEIMYFEYGQKEIDYLSKKDKKLCYAISKIGMIKREINSDIFSSVVHHIIGQQISTSAQISIWNRVKELLGEVNAKNVSKIEIKELQKCGMSFRKVEYIKLFTQSVTNGEIILDELHNKSDEEVIKILSSVKGIGVWTAEMLMTFCLVRPNILSYGDLAILRGMRMLYRHKEITPELFKKYQKRYTPYGTTASLYLWAIAGGAIEELKDPFPPTKLKKGTKKK